MTTLIGAATDYWGGRWEGHMPRWEGHMPRWGGHMDGAGAWGTHMGWGGGWMWLTTSLMIVAIALLVAIVVLLARRASGTATSGGTRARDILDERFAAGQLTADEYRDRARELGGGRRSPR